MAKCWRCWARDQKVTGSSLNIAQLWLLLYDSLLCVIFKNESIFLIEIFKNVSYKGERAHTYRSLNPFEKKVLKVIMGRDKYLEEYPVYTCFV